MDNKSPQGKVQIEKEKVNRILFLCIDKNKFVCYNCIREKNCDSIYVTSHFEFTQKTRGRILGFFVAIIMFVAAAVFYFFLLFSHVLRHS